MSDPRQDVVLLVDFGNTLVDETFLWHDCEAFPDWTAHWSQVMDALGLSWDSGRVTTEHVLAQMALLSGRPTDLVRQYFEDRCRAIVFFPQINRALARRRNRGGLQALVTVNPDCFGAFADHYGLEWLFDVIVTSSQIGDIDKVAICAAACACLKVQPSRTVLIDNIAPNVERWKEAGGLGYTFTEDSQFQDDVEQSRVPGFTAADLDG